MVWGMHAICSYRLPMTFPFTSYDKELKIEVYHPQIWKEPCNPARPKWTWRAVRCIHSSSHQCGLVIQFMAPGNLMWLIFQVWVLWMQTAAATGNTSWVNLRHTLGDLQSTATPCWQHWWAYADTLVQKHSQSPPWLQPHVSVKQFE